MLTNAQLSEISRDAQIAYALDKVPSFELAFARGVEAAATAEARALVGQMLKALDTCRWYSDDDGQIEQGFLDIPVDQAKAAARAWLGEAQKGDGHAGVR